MRSDHKTQQWIRDFCSSWLLQRVSIQLADTILLIMYSVMLCSIGSQT